MVHSQEKVNMTEPTHWTEPPTDNSVLDITNNGATIRMSVGDKRLVRLIGNATTGYAWRIVKMDGSSVKPDDKWHYKLKDPILMGSGGYFEREFEALSPGQTEVYFVYDPVAEPFPIGYYYYLRFDVRK